MFLPIFTIEIIARPSLGSVGAVLGRAGEREAQDLSIADASDVQPRVCERICDADSFLNAATGKCQTAKRCTATQYQTRALEPGSDRECAEHSECAEGSEWVVRDGGLANNRICKKHTECDTTTHYESRKPRRQRPRMPAPLPLRSRWSGCTGRLSAQ